MLLGIDASRAFKNLRTGTENYSYHLISEFAKIKTPDTFRLYLRENHPKKWPANFESKIIFWPRLWTQAGLAFECFKSPPDVLFIPAHTLPVVRRSKLKTVVTIHDLGAQFLPQYHTFPQKIYLNWSTNFAVKFATRIIAVSLATKKDLIEKLGAEEERIEVVYEGVDHQKFKVQSSKFKIEKALKKYQIKSPYLLFVGTIQPRKNVGRLIEAFAQVLKVTNGTKGPSGRKGIELVLAGAKGWLADEVYQLPKKLGVEKQIKFLGYVDEGDLPLLYNGALVFVLPSLVEGFGLPPLEAMACGCPTIVSQVSSLPEVAGEAGILIDPESVDSIAQGIKTVLDYYTSKPDQYQKLRQKGLAQAKKFSWEKCARETLAVLEKIGRKQNG